MTLPAATPNSKAGRKLPMMNIQSQTFTHAPWSCARNSSEQARTMSANSTSMIAR